MRKPDILVLTVAIILFVVAFIPDKQNWEHYFDLLCALGSGFLFGILFLKYN